MTSNKNGYPINDRLFNAHARILTSRKYAEVVVGYFACVA